MATTVHLLIHLLKKVLFYLYQKCCHGATGVFVFNEQQSRLNKNTNKYKNDRILLHGVEEHVQKAVSCRTWANLAEFEAAKSAFNAQSCCVCIDC